MGGDPKVVGTDRCGTAPQAGGLLGVVTADRRSFRLEHGHLTGQHFELLEGGFSALAAFRTLEQFSPRDEGHGQGVILCQGVDALGHLRRTPLDQINEDVGVEQVDHSDSRSCTGHFSLCCCSRAVT